ncbi:MAG: glycerophosphodiester phosphodiesterase [Nocardioidaceae bacterium]
MSRPRTGFAFLDSGLEHPGSVLAFAHRGGAFHPEIEGLENTLAAFRHAVDLGYTYLETDVHATSDGVLLAFHDAALDRVTGHEGTIVDLEHAEVADALIGGTEQIPRMSALLEEFPEARFNIDIKSSAAVAPLAELVRATNAHDRVCVGSFSERRITTFRRLVGRAVATAAGPRDVALHRFLPSRRLADVLTRGRAAALQVPHRFRGTKVVTRSLVERAHTVGKHVHVWVVDDPAEMRDLLDIGVDGLMTDRTDLLREVLIERGQWMGAAR